MNRRGHTGEGFPGSYAESRLPPGGAQELHLVQKFAVHGRGLFFYGEKPVDERVREDIEPQVEHLEAPKAVECAPSGA